LENGLEDKCGGVIVSSLRNFEKVLIWKRI